ncbi:hypothetical protein NFI96_013383 [Prochilodus magdalenae]|nr:hypothetical protein NFI96_013383 [Prochilodus magdalenae]
MPVKTLPSKEETRDKEEPSGLLSENPESMMVENTCCSALYRPLGALWRSARQPGCGIDAGEAAEEECFSMADLLGSILSSMEKPPTVGDQESRRKAREQQARLRKMQEEEKRKKAEFRKKMEKEVNDFIQDSALQKKKYEPMGKIERSILHDVAEVAGLTSFSFGEDEESRYVMLFKKEFAPSDEELEAYRKGEEWDVAKAEERRKLKEQAALEEQAASQTQKRPPSPSSNYRDKYSHLIGTSAAKDAAHTLEANRAYGCVPVANKRDTRSIEEAMNEIRAKKRLKKGDEDLGAGGGGSSSL